MIEDYSFGLPEYAFTQATWASVSHAKREPSARGASIGMGFRAGFMEIAFTLG